MSTQHLAYPDPPLRGHRFALRPWNDGDLDCVRLAATDPDIPRVTTVPATFTPNAGVAFIHRQQSRSEQGVGVSQAIVEVDGDRAIGMVWVAVRPQPHVGGLGYWVIPSDRGRGAATAAVRMVVPWALAALNLRRLEAWVEPENVGSQRVLHAAGFEPEGRLRQFLTIDGEAVDALVFSVIRPGQSPVAW